MTLTFDNRTEHYFALAERRTARLSDHDLGSPEPVDEETPVSTNCLHLLEVMGDRILADGAAHLAEALHEFTAPDTTVVLATGTTYWFDTTFGILFRNTTALNPGKFGDEPGDDISIITADKDDCLGFFSELAELLELLDAAASAVHA